MSEPERYQAVTLNNFEKFPQIQRLPEDLKKDIKIVGSVLPFKTNVYVMDNIINWDNVREDPMFILTFPQRTMLAADDYKSMEQLIDQKADHSKIKAQADKIRWTLNPHPAGQMEHNVPSLDGVRLDGMQHKYRETALFFPSQGQTCHAYCTFCFRWAQFVGMEGLKFASREGGLVAKYFQKNPQTSDILFTGGDPLIMKTDMLAAYIDELIKVKSLKTIRIGTKAISYWPQRFYQDKDAQALLDLFKKVVDAGKHVSIMAHVNHWVEWSTPEVRKAVALIRATGAQIRTQTPVLRNINDDTSIWVRKWQLEVEMGAIPYYMFVARDTGARKYFEVPLVKAWEMYRDAYQQVSGLARTVRGPSMSATPGKVQINGVAEVKGEKVIVLEFLQGRKAEWVKRPFFAKYDDKAVWLDELKPAFGEKEFFYEKDLKVILAQSTVKVKEKPAALSVDS